MKKIKTEKTNKKLILLIGNLIELRKKQKISSSEMARRCRVSRKTLYNFENLIHCSADLMFDYCDSLGFDISVVKYISIGYSADKI